MDEFHLALFFKKKNFTKVAMQAAAKTLEDLGSA
jgi:hypothetical protein